MSIMDFFNTATPNAQPATPPAAPQTAQPGNIPEGTGVAAQPAPGTAPNGVIPPAVATTPATPAEPESPLDPFNTLWETIENKGPEAEAPQALDPAKLSELVGKASFTQTVSQDDLAAVAQGGDSAVQALSNIVNAVAQQSMIQSTLAANKLIEQATATNKAVSATELTKALRANALQTNLQEANPIYSNPAVKPIMEATQAQLANKYPEATPTELTKMTQDYIAAMGEAFSPKPVVPVGQIPKEQDFSTWV